MVSKNQLHEVFRNDLGSLLNIQSDDVLIFNFAHSMQKVKNSANQKKVWQRSCQCHILGEEGGEKKLRNG